jgi:hypothetical protein
MEAEKEVEEEVVFQYLDLSDPDFERISAMVRKSYPKSCICWIERVKNPNLEAAYAACKASIGNEHLMFHGSSEDAIRTIAMTGFDPSRNKTSAFGKGTYFAKNASYSFNYMRHDKEGIAYMLLCRVLVGRPCLGSSNLRIDTTKFDSACNHTSHPTIVVTPHAAAACPDYIICFHKTARP